MNAQQKKNGWFFNKNIIDEINSVPEDVMVNTPVMPTIDTKNDEVAELKQRLAEKEEAFEQYKNDIKEEKRRLIRENESYKQTILKNGEEKTQNRHQIQNLEAEIRQNRKEIQSLQENQKSGDLKEKLDKAENRIMELNASLEHYQTVENELDRYKEKYHEIEMQQKFVDSQHQNAVQKIEKQLLEAQQTIQEKEETIHQVERGFNEREQSIQEKEALIQRLLEEQRDSSIEGEVVSDLQRQIMVIQKENDKLKQEAQYSQHEIGEVLVAARKQANRMVEKAKLDAQRIIKHSEEEIQTIQERAKEISFEVDESRQAIMVIYDELKTRVDQLAKNEVVLAEEASKFDYFDYSKLSASSK
ncbi:hypothetical protein [Candidatus Enterococcus murrayae]|uniref:Uncharacterized protein n=1 Tax=Candidatus Enterococcus murrayae TaxID=2815321 RepID=A0ABS3HBW7_9ENTE|nr:hypothetical protein [Enterococcus sp. MJM16]MBO0450942.1 hypothetical protein [Enterococcus sp. MJM16]